MPKIPIPKRVPSTSIYTKNKAPGRGIYESRMTKPELEFMEIDMGFSSKRMRHLSQERCALILKLNQSTTSCHISS